MQHTIRIEGVPVSWKAHGGYGRTSFNPRHKERERYQSIIRDQWCWEPLMTPCSISYEFFMKIPSSSSQKERDKILQNRVVHVKRPDLTNLQKFLEDCLKGIVIHDDSQVYHHEATKHYGETPCSIVNIFM